MDQGILIEAIGKHLDTLEAYFNWAILLSIVMTWAGIRREPEIDALGTKFNRKHAFFAVAALYLIANMAVLIVFLRIGDLLRLLSDQECLKGITKLATHSWVLNPFSFFGDSSLSHVHAGEGYGLLIAVWWLCNTSLYMLMDDKRNRAASILLGIFLLMGLTSMGAIQRVYALALLKLKIASLELYSQVLSTATERTIATFLGIIAGCLIYFAASLLQERWLKLGNLKKSPKKSVY